LTATGANLSTTGSISSLNTFGFENRIINGGMTIDQRNAGAAVTLTTAQFYTLDRWYGTNDTDGVMTAQQVSTAPTGFTNSVKLTTTTADAALAAGQFVRFVQAIEGYNMADFGWGTASAQTVTLSFWVRSSLTGTFGGAFRNSAGNRSYPFTYSISAADTWEQKSITVAGDTTGTWLTTNGVGVNVQFGLGVGTTYSGTAGAWAASYLLSATGAVSVIGTLNATWYVTGVQLEKGTQATSFDFRSIGQELALCQRYYEVFYADSAGEAGFSTPWSTSHRWIWHMKVQKRATSTFALVGAGNWQVNTPSVNGGISSCGAYSAVGNYYLQGGANAIAGAASAEL
jgi:hypothetical protein